MGAVTLAVPYTDRWYFASLVEGARRRIEGAGHRVVMHVVPPHHGSTAEAAAAIEQDFRDPESIGAIVAGFKYRADQTERVLAWQRPLVVIGGSVLGLPTVMIDDVGAGRLATEHLLSRGHTRIAHLTGSLDEQMDFSINGRRARGHRTLMEGAGLVPWIVETDVEPEAAHRSALALLSRPDRPTAVFAAFDELAFGVLAAARELDLEPGVDVAVVGIDDHPRSEEEGLTTVRQRPVEVGDTAARMLLDGLAHGPDPKQSRLHPISLVTRHSTARR